MPAGREWISIHALREEGDISAYLPAASLSDFYPRPPRGGRQHPELQDIPARIFLSTPSARRATGDQMVQLKGWCYFYPRPPRGGRRTGWKAWQDGTKISIHALREEGDSVASTMCFTSVRFLSTPSARRATGEALNFTRSSVISIHALREEGDSKNRDKISIFL